MISSRTVAIAVCLLVITAGCTVTERNPTWDLSVNGYQEQVNDQYRFNGSVGLGGHFTEVTVKNVSVIFIGQNGPVLDKKNVGNLDRHRADVQLNVTVEEPIQYVVLSVGEIESESDFRCEFSGLEKTDRGLYPTSMSQLPDRGSLPDHPCRGN